MKTVLIAVLLLFNIASSARTMESKVVRIVDGDSMVFLDGGKVEHCARFGGIDAPERKQPFGARSTQNLGPFSSNKPPALSGTRKTIGNGNQDYISRKLTTFETLDLFCSRCRSGIVYCRRLQLGGQL